MRGFDDHLIEGEHALRPTAAWSLVFELCSSITAILAEERSTQCRCMFTAAEIYRRSHHYSVILGLDFHDVPPAVRTLLHA